MPIDKETLRQIGHFIRPLAARISNTIVRGVVQLADDDLKQQLLQLGALAGQTIADAENFQPYGLSAIPLAGAEHVTIFPNGDQSHPITIAVSDRRHRPTGGSPGEVTLHCHTGAVVIMKTNGDIELQPAPGHEVLIRDAGGTVDALVKKGEYDGHTHPAGTLAAPGGGGPVTGVSGGAAAVTGTQRLRAQ
jgi:phage baseplate assembly protein V